MDQPANQRPDPAATPQPRVAAAPNGSPSALHPQPSALLGEAGHVTPESNGGATPQLPTLEPQLCFPRLPGETPRAFAAFLAYFQLGQTRSLSATADGLGENPATVKNWSSKYQWSHRLHSFYSGLLRTQAETETARQSQAAADWARRTREFREHEWAAGQKLLTAVLCFLENFGDRDVEKMTLGQVSRALQISTRVSRQALRADHDTDDPAPTSLQTDLLAALKKAYGQPTTVTVPEPSVSDVHN